jgi:hypothetical protein
MENIEKQKVNNLNLDKNDYKPSIINCTLEFECPLLWENLKETNNPDIRFCNKCKENVYHVKNQEELNKLPKSKCIMYELNNDISPASIPQNNVEQVNLTNLQIRPNKNPKVRMMGKRVR